MNRNSINTTKLKMHVAILAIVSLALLPTISAYRKSHLRADEAGT